MPDITPIPPGKPQLPPPANPPPQPADEEVPAIWDAQEGPWCQAFHVPPRGIHPPCEASGEAIHMDTIASLEWVWPCSSGIST